MRALVYGADDPPRGMVNPGPVSADDLDAVALEKVYAALPPSWVVHFTPEIHEAIRVYLRASGIKALCTSLEFGIQRYQQANVELVEENCRLREYIQAECIPVEV